MCSSDLGYSRVKKGSDSDTFGSITGVNHLDSEFLAHTALDSESLKKERKEREIAYGSTEHCMLLGIEHGG